MRRSFLACGRDTQGPRHACPVLIDPAAERTLCPGPAAELLLTPAPRTVASEAYRSPEGAFQAGIWQCGAFDRQPAVARHYELMQIIEGEAALQDAEYGEEPFRKGHGVLVHPGIRYVLRAKGTFAKVYATVTVSSQ